MTAKFNQPPGWLIPDGKEPGPQWRPPRSWPRIPVDWQLYEPADEASPWQKDLQSWEEDRRDVALMHGLPELANGQAEPALENLIPVDGQSGRRRSRRVLLLVSAGLAAVAIAVAAFFVFRTQTHDVMVTFTLIDADLTAGSCQGSGGYSDIGPGTRVVMRDESGEILGSSTLGQGAGFGTVCAFVSTVEDVPLDRDFYSVEVGSRGEITSSRADLEADGFEFSVTLGSLG